MSKSLRIAVADHDPAMYEFYQVALARLGHHVCVALSGRQLVEQWRFLRPDLVVAGVKLPNLDGITASEEVCRDHPTPIILVAGGHDAEAVKRICDNQYIMACLFKPVEEADLGAVIAFAMCRFEQFQSLRQEVADLRQALEDRKLIERAKGAVTKYTGLDEEEAYRRLRKLASDQNRKVVEVAQAVLTAGEVFQDMESAGEVRQANGEPTRCVRTIRPHRNGSQVVRAE